MSNQQTSESNMTESSKKKSIDIGSIVHGAPESVSLQFNQSEQTQVSCLTLDSAIDANKFSTQINNMSSAYKPAVLKHNNSTSISITSLKKGFSTKRSPLDKDKIIPNDDTNKKYEIYEFCPHPTSDLEDNFKLVKPKLSKRNMDKWKYFHEIEYCKGMPRPFSHMDGLEYICCNICGDAIKYKIPDPKTKKVKATHSFMTSHLATKHGINNAKKVKASSILAKESSTILTSFQKTDEPKYKNDIEKNAILKEKITDWVIKDYQSLSVVESTSYRDMMKAAWPGFKPFTNKEVKRIITEKAREGDIVFLNQTSSWHDKVMLMDNDEDDDEEDSEDE